MATNLVRFDAGSGARWGVVTGTEIAPLSGDYPTTAALIEQGEAEWRAASKGAARVALDSVKILSPVTTPWSATASIVFSGMVLTVFGPTSSVTYKVSE